MLENSFGNRIDEATLSSLLSVAQTIIVHGHDNNHEVEASSRPWKIDA
jgi:hypothetical protein